MHTRVVVARQMQKSLAASCDSPAAAAVCGLSDYSWLDSHPKRCGCVLLPALTHCRLT